jgi:hypothetical protein
MFHLSLVAKVRDVNDLICIEKLDRVSVSKDLSEGEGLEIFPIPLHGKQFTIFEMLEKARADVGDNKFFEYDAFRNNCQWFISYLLKGQGLYGEREKEFVFQDISSIVAELPSYVTDFQRGVTDITATFNKITGGRKRLVGGMDSRQKKQMIKEIEQMILFLSKFSGNVDNSDLVEFMTNVHNGTANLVQDYNFYRGELQQEIAMRIQMAEDMDLDGVVPEVIEYLSDYPLDVLFGLFDYHEKLLNPVEDDDMGSMEAQQSDSDEDVEAQQSDSDEEKHPQGSGMFGGAYEPPGMMLPFSSSQGYHQYGFGINIPQKEFVKEHRHLVKLLNKSSIPALRREAHKQGKELKMRGGADIRIQPEPRILYPSPLNPRKLDIRDTMKPLRL